jgi:Ca2+-binding EF-hand superfamily protein
VECDYIAERFFEVMSGAKGVTITKPRFYKKVLKLIRGNYVYLSKWAFNLYDADGDGIITIDELYDMQVSLPAGSQAYQECSR